jgi:flagellar biosynthesis/type III secretory pathway M-ring protein FliF/YscJ
MAERRGYDEPPWRSGAEIDGFSRLDQFWNRKRWMMIVPVMWVVWCSLVVLLLIVKMYASRLSRDEDDQLVLQDSFDHVRVEQANIVARLNKLQPIQTGVLVALGLATLFVAGYYVLDIVNQFK